MALHPHLAEEGAIELVPMMTSGDAMQAGSLSALGGKGLFTKELELALLKREIDLAVHSAKDMQTLLPEGLMLACTPEREDPRDVLIAPGFSSLEALPEHAVFGTASLRRQVQVLRVRPDLKIAPLRGNVQTRLNKINSGAADATMLAMAGLKRLKMQPLPGIPLSVEQCIPAVGQGALGIECRETDEATRALLTGLNHVPTMLAVTCERALLARVDGSCRTPVAGYAQVRQDQLYLSAMLASEDGKQCWFAEAEGVKAEAEVLGSRVGEKLMQKRASLI